MGRGLSEDINFFMSEAIKEARKALEKNEVPVGAVIVRNGEIISRGYNLRETKKDILCHAEIVAIRKAYRKLGDWRFYGCTIYVTLEPCIMCFGAILQARFDKLIYGASNHEEGFSRFICNIENYKKWQKLEIVAGIMKEESEEIIRRFFTNLRSSP